jgi:glycerol-3-phosphate acyltransferase PlsY
MKDDIMIKQIVFSSLIGYLLGCIQAAYLLSKTVGKIDIREHGSGNAGASNITSVMGLKYGAIVGVVDVLKGILAVLIVKSIYPDSPDLAFLAGLMAILGHIFPFFLKFRGGKGVATLIGMMIGINWKMGLLFVVLVAAPALISDYIAVGSLTAFLGLPIMASVNRYPLVLILLSVLISLLSFFLHRHNIQRIIKMEELKISSTLKKK